MSNSEIDFTRLVMIFRRLGSSETSAQMYASSLQGNIDPRKGLTDEELANAIGVVLDDPKTHDEIIEAIRNPRGD